MAVPRKVVIEGSKIIGSYPAASRIAYGAALVASTTTEGAETVAPAEIAAMGIIGFANKREWIPKGSYDGFYEAGEMVEVVADYACALVTPNGQAGGICLGDFMEVAILGDGTPGAHGLLQEEGATAGAVRATDTVAQALESRTMAATSYHTTTTNSVGDTSLAVDSGDPTTMGLSVGDYIYLEDLNGAGQVNKVASLTATAIGLVIPATVVMTSGDSDLLTKLFHVKVRMV